MRVLVLAAALGVVAAPAPIALRPVVASPRPEVGALPFGLGLAAPQLITLRTTAIVIEGPPPPTTTTTAAPSTTTVAPKPKPPVGDSKNDKNKVDTRAKPKAAGLPLGSPFVGSYVGTDIEGFARLESQTTCDPTPKAGTLALRDLLLSRYPTTISLGVSRACDIGGQSEHKEGRAFDWGADVTNASDVAAVNDFLAALLATDAQGHKDALARRLGVMYVIWDHQIWGAYQSNDGWRPYDGDNPHTDHVHISLSWAGARAETSYWSGHVVPGLPDNVPRPPRTTTTTRPSRATTTTTRAPRSTTTTVHSASTTTSSPSSTTTTGPPRS
ncbi:MAG: hypothetical protein QOJ00_2680 [Actinomycetota bacterium]